LGHLRVPLLSPIGQRVRADAGRDHTLDRQLCRWLLLSLDVCRAPTCEWRRSRRSLSSRDKDRNSNPVAAERAGSNTGHRVRRWSPREREV